MTKKDLTNAYKVIEDLKKGNQRYMKGDFLNHIGKRYQFLKEQKPKAIVLGCSDARVPVELLFDSGVGELFVIRVAGNIVAPSQIESIEFAVKYLNVQLVVVLGHTSCGAVKATIDACIDKKCDGHLQSIIERIRPSVIGLMNTELVNDRELLEKCAIRNNVGLSVSHLRHGSAILEQEVNDNNLLIVGAEYKVETGEVEFFEQD